VLPKNVFSHQKHTPRFSNKYCHVLLLLLSWDFESKVLIPNIVHWCLVPVRCSIPSRRRTRHFVLSGDHEYRRWRYCLSQCWLLQLQSEGQDRSHNGSAVPVVFHEREVVSDPGASAASFGCWRLRASAKQWVVFLFVVVWKNVCWHKEDGNGPDNQKTWTVNYQIIGWDPNRKKLFLRKIHIQHLFLLYCMSSLLQAKMLPRVEFCLSLREGGGSTYSILSVHEHCQILWNKYYSKCIFERKKISEDCLLERYFG